MQSSATHVGDLRVRRGADRAGAVLVTVFYADPHAGRRREFLECLDRNTASGLFSEVHVFLEDGRRPQLDHPKLRLVEHGRRATYRDLFDYASVQLSGRRVVVANADIHFGDDLARLDRYGLTGKMLCLSRWDVQPDGSARFFEHGESQDAWIFDAPLAPFPCGFHLGVPGCDNRLAWEAAHAGLAVENPARSLRAYHLHLSGVRRYKERHRIGGNVLSIPAGFLGPAVDMRCASVAFAEAMGYALATLEPGVSSHVNAERPFTSIPEALRGRRFTQVVASTVSPVEVEFLTSGKLFVLAGNDWYGYDIAREWLAEHGYDERLPCADTVDGAGFEVWSLVGAAGDRFVLPTQVMLVADRLRRRRG
jgi:hypothetical protein